MHPQEMSMAWLGEMEGDESHEASFTMSEGGVRYAPVRLPDGREGLWGCAVDGGAVILDPEGPWWWVGEGVRLEADLSGSGEREDGQLFDYHFDPRGLEDGCIPVEEWDLLTTPHRVAMWVVHAERSTDPAQ
jgi:hypothetical protein